jgi:hypothetical protein
VAHLKTFFGGMRAVEITTGKMREYVKARRAAGAEPGTVNRDLGALSRMFTLALQAGKLSLGGPTSLDCPRISRARVSWSTLNIWPSGRRS